MSSGQDNTDYHCSINARSLLCYFLPEHAFEKIDSGHLKKLISEKIWRDANSNKEMAHSMQ